MPVPPPSFVAFAKRVLRLQFTPQQFVYALVAFDGWDPEQLAGDDRAIAAQLFGPGVLRIPHGARRILISRFGRDSGKTLLAAAFLVYRALFADVSHCGPGDIPAAVTVSLRLSSAGLALKAATALVDACPEIARRKRNLDGKAREAGSLGFSLVRYDGVLVQVMTLPKGAGGGALRGFSLVSLLVDEAEFVNMAGSDAAVTDAALINAAMPRLLVGGKIILASTPWPSGSETARLFNANRNNPTSALAVHGSTVFLRNYDPETVGKVAAERARDAQNCKREFDAEETAIGVVFDDSWWRFWHEQEGIPSPHDPSGQTMCPLFPALGFSFQSWDCAFKGAETSDYVVGGVIRTYAGGVYVARDLVRARLTFSRTLNAMLALSAAHPEAVEVLVEDAANGAAVCDALKDDLPGLKLVKPLGGKEARAAAGSPAIAAGRVYLPHPDIAPWVPDFIAEHRAFPHGDNDDQVDFLSQALIRLRLTGWDAMRAAMANVFDGPEAGL